MQVIQAAYAQLGLERPTGGVAAQVDHLISHLGAHGAAATAAAATAVPGAASVPGPSSSQGSSPRPPRHAADERHGGHGRPRRRALARARPGH